VTESESGSTHAEPLNARMSPISDAAQRTFFELDMIHQPSGMLRIKCVRDLYSSVSFGPSRAFKDMGNK